MSRTASFICTLILIKVAVISENSALAETPENWRSGVPTDNVPCSKILVVAPLSTASHVFVYAAFARGLAERCHQVDMLVSYESKRHRHPNLNQISTPTFRRISDDLFFFKVDEMPPYHWLPGTLYTIWYMSQSANLCSEMLDDDKFREFLDKPDDYYDMTYISPHLVDDCALAFAHKARRGGKPWGHLFSSLLVPWVAQAFGNPGLATYRPLFTTAWSLPMTFSQQLISQVTNDVVTTLRTKWFYTDVRNVLAEKWDSSVPDLAELELTSTISLSNEEPRLFNYQQPRTADLIDMGGVHIDPPQPLPKHLDDWANAAANGFVLFALGSAVKSENFPEEARKMFVEAFEQFPDVQFLWKWDNATMDGLPNNVHLEGWLPQQDILGHKNIRGFITHGGMLSTQEATYNGVPIIGLPIAAEQHVNMARVVSVDNAGDVLSWSDLSVDRIVQALRKILQDKSVIDSVKRRQQIFRDQPETPMERGIFWTEYVIRNKYDTRLRSPTRDMCWFEMYGVHIWLFVIAVATVWLAISVYISSLAVKGILRLFKLTSGDAERSVANKQVKFKGKNRPKRD